MLCIPLKPKYGLNGPPKAFVGGVISLLTRLRESAAQDDDFCGSLTKNNPKVSAYEGYAPSFSAKGTRPLPMGLCYDTDSVGTTEAAKEQSRRDG